MTLALDQLEPGVVAFLDTRILLADHRLTRRGTDSFRSGPFVCVAIGAGRTTWLELTSRPGRYNHRLLIRPAWRIAGPVAWQRTDAYCNNPGEPFVGRGVVFADAARCEPPGWAAGASQRARVTPEGVDFIVAEMCARNSLTV